MTLSEQLRELAGKATKGPFEAVHGGDGSFSDTVIRRCGSEKIASLEWRWFEEIDGQLITQLLNNLPTILSALELQERLGKVETHRIGDAVEILPETAGMDWQGEPPHYITGIDWHSKYGVTYTTSETWPPRCEGLQYGGVGLTDEWQPKHLRIALMKGGAQ